jgi:hypothetical protein
MNHAECVWLNPTACPVHGSEARRVAAGRPPGRRQDLAGMAERAREGHAQLVELARSQRGEAIDARAALAILSELVAAHTFGLNVWALTNRQPAALIVPRGHVAEGARVWGLPCRGADVDAPMIAFTP